MADEPVVVPSWVLSLQGLPRWCRWRLLANPNGRATKVPDQSTAQLTECRSWSQVEKAARTRESGVGLVLTAGVFLPGGERLLCLDLDACIADDGSLPLEVEQLLDRFPGPTESSPSRRGLHVWFVIDEPLPPRIRTKVAAPWSAPTGVDKRPEIQLFGAGPAGYVTWTGVHLEGTPTEFRPVPVSALVELLGEHPADLSGAVPTGWGTEPTVAEITEAVTAAKNGARLLRAEWEGLDYESASEAFFALAVRVLRAANGHGEAALEFLLQHTAWGQGLVPESRDAGKYARDSWVRREIARAAAKSDAMQADPTAAFEALDDLQGESKQSSQLPSATPTEKLPGAPASAPGLTPPDSPPAGVPISEPRKETPSPPQGSSSASAAPALATHIATPAATAGVEPPSSAQGSSSVDTGPSLATRIATPLATASPARPSSPFTTVAELLAQPRRPDLWSRMMPRGSLSIWFGAPKSGKTYLALGLGVAVAEGKPFLGRRVAKGRVLYVAGEGVRGVADKVAAALGPARAADIADPFHRDFLVLPSMPRLVDPKTMAAVLGAIEDAGPVDLIIVDTLARAIGASAMDENSSEDMNAFVAALDTLWRQTGASVLGVHHENKSGGDRGSSVLRGAADVFARVERAGKRTSVFTVQDMRDGEPRPPLETVWESVVVGIDEDNEPVERWRVGSFYEQGDPRFGAELKEPERRILKVLREAGEPLSRKAIEDRIGGSKASVLRWLTALEDKRLIVVGGKQSNKTFTFTVAESEGFGETVGNS